MTSTAEIDNAAFIVPPSTTATQAAKSELGQEDFLTLMIAQFRNQDPFEPMQNGDFLSQLAQFGTVSGIEELNGAFAGLQASLQSDQVLKASGLVGRSVLAATDSGYVADEGGLSGAVELAGSVSNLQVEITDGRGELVRRLDLGAHEAGLVTFEWDGRDMQGEAVDPGHYAVSARAAQGNQVESVVTLLDATIESVSLAGPGQPMTLNLAGGGVLAVDQVRRIY